MPETPLLTLLHISDLHLGELAPGSGDHPLDAKTLVYWRLNRQFDGYLGHTWRALCALSGLSYELEETHPTRPLHVVVSGDLTTMGTGSQFATALKFLQGNLKHTGNVQIGLGLNPSELTIVPGNHDHWPGRRFMLGQPTSNFSSVFNLPFPKSNVRISLGNGLCTLVLAQIDSDAEVGTWSKDRLLARGSFVQQCWTLGTFLGPPEPNELRALIVHHSTIERGDPSLTLKINSVSLNALKTLVAYTGIKIVLTGHWHFSDFQAPSSLSPSPDILEARCGTTTVRDYFAGKALYRNSALVHRLSSDGTRIHWITEFWLRPLLFTTNPKLPVGSRFERGDTIDFGFVWP